MLSAYATQLHLQRLLDALPPGVSSEGELPWWRGDACGGAGHTGSASPPRHLQSCDRGDLL